MRWTYTSADTTPQSKIAYYNWMNDNKMRRLREMKDDLSHSAFKWRYHRDYSGEDISVGDKKLIEFKSSTIGLERCRLEEPMFNSYNAALKWLKGEEEMPTFNPNPFDLTFSLDVENHSLFLETVNKKLPPIKRIEQNAKNGTIYTTVLWEDNSDATVVKCAEDDTNDLYFAVASAIAIKLFGSNSAFKRMISDKADIQDIQEEKPTEFSFEVNMNNFAENVKKHLGARGGYND